MARIFLGVVVLAAVCGTALADWSQKDISALESVSQDMLHTFYPTGDDYLDSRIEQRQKLARQRFTKLVSGNPSSGKLPETSDMRPQSVIHLLVWYLDRVLAVMSKFYLSSGEYESITPGEVFRRNPHAFDFLKIALEHYSGEINTYADTKGVRSMDPDEPIDGLTPFHIAVRMLQRGAMRMLVDFGADPLKVTEVAETSALEMAAQLDDMESTKIIVNWMLKKGKCPLRQVKKAIQIAVLHRFDELRDYLSQNACKNQLIRVEPMEMPLIRDPVDAIVHQPNKKGKRVWDSEAASELDSDECDIDRIHVSNLTAINFFQNYIVQQRPVVITGAGHNWAAIKQWTPKKLAKKYGQYKVRVGSIPYGENFGLKEGRTPLKEYVQYTDETKTLPESKNVPYCFDDHIMRDQPKLKRQVPFPSLFAHLGNSTDCDKCYHQFILGPPGSGAPVHFHCDAVNGIIWGKKRWALVPPGRTFYSVEHPREWVPDTDFESSPDYKQCVQYPGELVYVPRFWGHAVLNVATTVGFAVEFDEGCHVEK